MSILKVNTIQHANGTEALTVNSNGTIRQLEMPITSVRLLGAQQSISNATWTVVQFDSKDVDSHNFYDTSTYTYTPTIAGWYQFNFGIYAIATGMTALTVVLRKNGDEQQGLRGAYHPPGVSTSGACNGSGILYMNGSTDSVQVLGYSVATSGNVFHNHTATRLTAHLVKAD